MRRFRITPRQELDYLKAKQSELTNKLSELKAKQDRELSTDNSWKIRAAMQAQFARKAKQENERLRRLLEEQLKVVDAIEQVLEKRPKIADSMANSVHLDQATLGIHNRLEGLEYMMQSQYEKFDTEWIIHDIYNATEQCMPVSKSFVMPMYGNEVAQVNFIRRALITINFKEMADILLHYNTIEVPTGRKASSYSLYCCVTILQNFIQIWYTLSRDTLSLANSALPTLYSYVAGRRWDEDDRVVITWRTILGDKLYPTSSDEMIQNRIAWSVISRVNANTSYIAVLMKISADLTPLSRHRPPNPGTFTEHILRLYHEMSESFGEVIQKAINERIEKHAIGLNEK